jgi:peptide/nickel transport system permease protein
MATIGIAIGIYSAVRQYSFVDYAFTAFSFIGFAMPTFWLALLLQTLFVDALYSRFVRAAMLDTINADFIRTARAKGVRESRVIVRHVFRNALIPFVTVAALNIGGLLGGAIVTETVFSLDGIGFYFVQKLGILDLYAVMAYLLVTSVIVIAFNLIADLLYGVLDPRVRLA